MSTCGIVPGIERLTGEGLPVTLALSLHAPNDQVRRELMPVANRYGLSEVLLACRGYFLKTGRRLTFEYSLVKGVNDDLSHARALAKLLKDQQGHVNLIPVNHIKERDYVQSGSKAVEEFKHCLEKAGSTLRSGERWGGTSAGPAGSCGEGLWKPRQKGGLMKMRAYGMTDVGMVRDRNQDYIYCSSDPVGGLDNLFLVADGMGGHRAGDYASRFLVEGLAAYAGRREDGTAVQVIQEGLRQINGKLYEASLKNSTLHGMGTTLVAASVEGNTLYAANVGDSRLYLFRDKRLFQITRDHSYVEELVALGQMERNSRDYQRKKNIITRAIGVAEHVEADFFEEELLPEDLILMCSDGLCNMLEDEETAAVLGQRGSLKQKTERLISQANDRGGYDNIAVIVIDPQIGEVGSC